MPPPTSRVTIKDLNTAGGSTHYDSDMNLAAILFDKNCGTSFQDLNTYTLSELTIAFSQYSYSSCTVSPITDTNPQCHIPTRAFSILYSELSAHPLDDTLTIPDPQRNPEHLPPLAILRFNKPQCAQLF
ncbi:hypothetical protein BDQ17DRAFT_1421424 [Cyathus striatus]|nr:hypothetical protein BDQ17DRAFT_1421424 [Cyathus striatus]